MSEPQVFRVVDVETGLTMRSRRTGDLALYEDLGAARRSANAYRGYYGVSRAFRVQELVTEYAYPPILVWEDVSE